MTAPGTSRAAAVTPLPPIAPRRPHPVVRHGERFEDDYFWLREKTDPEVIAYLEAENAYTDQIMASTRPLQERLYEEMLGRIQQTDLTVPYRHGEWLYYARTEEGKQYPIHCRKRGSLEAPEEVVLDLNRLSEGQPFLAVGVMTVSDDGHLLAYSTDVTGFRVYDLRVRDLRSGEDLPDTAHDVESVAWASDNRTLLYVVKDPAKRPARLFRHRLGAMGADELLFEEGDERFHISVGRSRSRALLFLSSDSHTQSEVRFRRADLADDWALIAPRAPDHEYHVDHHGDRLYILTNQGARHFRMVSAPLDSPGTGSWREELAHRPEVMLEDLDCFEHHLVVTEREDGLVRLRIIDVTTGRSDRVEFPEPVYTAAPGVNREYGATTFRYNYQSFTTPPSVYEVELGTRATTLLKQTEVLGGYDPTAYVSLRLHATAPDGTSVPISLVHRRDRPPGRSPLLLYGYGAYGMPLSAGFKSNRFSLLDRGLLFAMAHVRGGGELGKTWHDQGRMLNKPNTFSDFIACAEHLIEAGWTAPDRLAIHGGSAGGLLLGAVINQRPDLFATALTVVPFVDVLNSMSDESLPLTVGEYEEWGNPANPVEFASMRGYCPYTNLTEMNYPAMLVRTSLHDSQVMYWEPAKYVARLRTLKTDHQPLLLWVNMKAGHGGSSGRYDFLREVAFDYAFLIMRLGLEPGLKPTS